MKEVDTAALARSFRESRNFIVGLADAPARRALGCGTVSSRRDEMLKLYYAPGTCALASHIALEEAGATYETVRLDFKAEDQKKPDYLKINPKARVPSLLTAEGVLTETPAIL